MPGPDRRYRHPLEPRNSRVAHIIAAPDFDQRLAGLPSRQGLLDLMWRQLQLATEPNAAGLCPLPPFVRASLDKLALEFRQATKHSQHQPPVRCCRVRPSIRDRTEASAYLADRV